MQWPNVEPPSLTYSVICAKGTSRHRERSRCCCAGSATSLGQWPPALGRAEPQAQQLQKCLFVCIWCLNSASPFLFHPIPVTQGHSVCVHSTRPAFSVQVSSATPLQLLGQACVLVPVCIQQRRLLFSNRGPSGISVTVQSVQRLFFSIRFLPCSPRCRIKINKHGITTTIKLKKKKLEVLSLKKRVEQGKSAEPI